VTNRRTVIVIVAVVLAMAAGMVSWRYLSTANDRAFKNAELVEYLVVKKDVVKGMPGERALDEGFIVKDRIPRKFFPAKAITNGQDLRGKVSLADLAAGLPIVDGDFVDPRVATVTFAQRIPKGMQAITVSVDNVKGVAGLVVPGDRVNMLVTLNNQTQFMLQNLQVLAIGQASELSPAEVNTTVKPGQSATVPTTNAGLMTFAVDSRDAAKIAEATAVGSIYLTLVPPDFAPAPVPAINAGNLFV
jgi:pilus assembly protein CpaB